MQVSKNYFLRWTKDRGCFNFKNGYMLWKQGKKVTLSNIDIGYEKEFKDLEDAYENGMMGNVSIKDFLENARDDLFIGFINMA